MREILFRAWDLKQKHFVYFELRQKVNDHTPPIYGDANLQGWDQFTGLKDKNGVEIYEGDVVRHFGIINNWIVEYGEYQREKFEGRDNQQKHLGFYGKPISNFDSKRKIEWNNSSVSLVGEDFRNGIEVIGNIYENKKDLQPKEL